jgi:diguanylate cyclase (GGDEF)-like protein
LGAWLSPWAASAPLRARRYDSRAHGERLHAAAGVHCAATSRITPCAPPTRTRTHPPRSRARTVPRAVSATPARTLASSCCKASRSAGASTSANALTLGRAAECDFHIDERSVSRQHARIWRDHGGYRLKDLGSTNKTLLNDVPVGEVELKDGDHLTIGSCVLKFMERSSVEARYHDEIYQLATLDPLTGLYNRRHFLELFGRELQRSMRHRRPLSLLIVDLDHFKAINDCHGHVIGDAVLEQVGIALQAAVRREAIGARIGGEEFAIALPEHEPDAALVVSEQLRRAIETMPLQLTGGPCTVTVSVGVAAWRPSMRKTADLLRAADDALYRAKQAGRNRVVVAE